MEDSGFPTSSPSAGPTPPAPSPSAGGSAYPSATPPLPPPPSPRRGGGWKTVVTVLAILAVIGLGCCGWSVALGSIETDGLMLGQDGIALIHIDGAIAGTGSRLDGYITPESVISQIERAESDERVRAILLRIDSPGGTVAASEEIALAVERAQKPVVASIGDVGASGAYMIASQCDEIVAARTSAVGSIGVIMTIPNVEGLLDKVGVKFRVFTQGKYKDVGSPFRGVTDAEAKMLDRQAEQAYEEFIAVVAKGRKMDVKKVREMATGWVWLGEEAKQMGLVDTLGNYSDAVDAAAEQGGIEGTPGIVTYEQDGLSEFLRSITRISSQLGRMGEVTSGSTGTPAVPK